MPHDNTFLILREGEAEGLVTPAEALEAIGSAWQEYGRARHVLSSPAAMKMLSGATTFKVKGAVLGQSGIAGFRLVADRHEAAGETTRDWFWLADPDGGRPLALVEAFGLHCLRTAATGALAARLLAPAGITTAALIGSGRIAAHVLPALAAALPGLRQVAVASRRFEAVQQFCATAQPGLPFALRPAPSVREACAGASLVVTITSATAPVLHAAHLSPGATVVGLGDTEIAADVLAWADRFVVDELAFALTTGSVAGWIAGDAVTAAGVAARLDADIGQVAAALKPGRLRLEDNVLAVVQGMAVGDLALAGLAWRKACATGLGASVDLVGRGPVSI
jgi:ornithine cyclodeaminase